MEAIFIVKFGNWFWKYNLFNLYHNPFSQVNIIIERSKYINEENHWQEKYSLKQSEITRDVFRKQPSTLSELCPCGELFWSVVSRIRTEYGEIRSMIWFKEYRRSADLVSFTEEILNGKFHFFCSVRIEEYTELIRSFQNNLFSPRFSKIVKASSSRLINTIFWLGKERKLTKKVEMTVRILFKVHNDIEGHCMKSVRSRSYSGPHFPALRLNTERYGVSVHIQS